MKNDKLKPVVITTQHRGVFFGYVEELAIPDNKVIVAKEVRMCVYWSSDVHGVVGLASGGATKNCKITPAAPEMIITDVTSVMLASPAARDSWESEPWS